MDWEVEGGAAMGALVDWAVRKALVAVHEGRQLHHIGNLTGKRDS